MRVRASLIRERANRANRGGWEEKRIGEPAAKPDETGRGRKDRRGPTRDGRKTGLRHLARRPAKMWRIEFRIRNDRIPDVGFFRSETFGCRLRKRRRASSEVSSSFLCSERFGNVLESGKLLKGILAPNAPRGLRKMLFRRYNVPTIAGKSMSFRRHDSLTTCGMMPGWWTTLTILVPRPSPTAPTPIAERRRDRIRSLPPASLPSARGAKRRRGRSEEREGQPSTNASSPLPALRRPDATAHRVRKPNGRDRPGFRASGTDGFGHFDWNTS